MDVVTIDLAEGCDHRLDVARDPLPDLGDVDVCVSNAAITDTIAPAHRMTRRAVAARHRREPDRRVPRRAGVPGGHARAPLRADRRDLERRGRSRAAGPGRLQRLEGRADRDGARRSPPRTSRAGSPPTPCCPGWSRPRTCSRCRREVLERVRAPAARRADGEPAEVAGAGRLPRLGGGRLRHRPGDRDRRRLALNTLSLTRTP